MQNSNNDGTSSDTDITDILKINPRILWAELNTPPLPNLSSHVSEYQSLQEVLYPELLTMNLESSDEGDLSLFMSDYSINWQETSRLKVPTLPKDYKILYPQIPKFHSNEIRVVPFSNPWSVLHTVVVDGTQNCLLFSPLKYILGRSLHYRPLHNAGSRISWAFYKAGSITESESHRITRLKGYVMNVDGDIIGVLFEWRDGQRRRVEDLGPEFSYRLGAPGVVVGQETRKERSGDEWTQWNSKVQWKNYLEEVA